MRIVIFLMLIVLSDIVYAEEAYVLIDAINIAENESQPTWIGLGNIGGGLHVPTNQTIIKLAPGNYTIDHIDFNSSPTAHNTYNSRLSDRSASFEEDIRFRAIEGTITYVGLIEIPSYGVVLGKKAVKLSFNKVLLAWACSKNTNVFEKMPVRFPKDAYEGKLVKINCET